MNEVVGENIKDTHPGRRGVFKFGACLATGAAISAITHSEIERVKQGVITEVGVFIPLYERHDIGVKPEDIPQNLDVFFEELVLGNQLMTLSKEEILNCEAIAYDNFNFIKRKTIKVFPSETLSKLAQQGTEVMLGDVSVYSKPENELPIKLTEALAANAAMIALIKSPSQTEIDRKKGVTRRKVLKGALAGAWLWSSSTVAGNALSFLGPTQEGAVKRIAVRLAGIQTHAHPELLLQFFRNLLMVDKLSTVGEEIKQRTGKTPRIAFQVQGGHSGIEDFLMLGPDFCRTLILAYPKGILRHVVNLNNGIEDFCTARLLRLPKDLGTGGKEKDAELIKSTTERTVVDQKLERELETKLKASR